MKKVRIETKNDEKILIAVISNKAALPTYFVKDLLALYIQTKNMYRNTELNFVSACSVNHMRNVACKYAVDNEFDYMVQLDDDHKYPSSFIIEFMKHKKEFVCGPTSQRFPPFLPTQFKQYKLDGFKDEENRIIVSPKDTGLVQVGMTGVVGALIKVSALKKIKYPYFLITYESEEHYTGGDVYFTKQLEEAKIERWMDTRFGFPHNLNNMFIDKGDIKHIF